MSEPEVGEKALYEKAQRLASEGLGRRELQERLVQDGADPEAAQVMASAVIPPNPVSIGDPMDERVGVTDFLQPRMEPNTGISFGLFLLVGGAGAFIWWAFGEGGNAWPVVGGVALLLGTVMLTLGLALFRAREHERRRRPAPPSAPAAPVPEAGEAKSEA